jgi:hypothetical protein
MTIDEDEGGGAYRSILKTFLFICFTDNDEQWAYPWRSGAVDFVLRILMTAHDGV